MWITSHCKTPYYFTIQCRTIFLGCIVTVLITTLPLFCRAPLLDRSSVYYYTDYVAGGPSELLVPLEVDVDF
jgi:hypothetical protein